MTSMASTSSESASVCGGSYSGRAAEVAWELFNLGCVHYRCYQDRELLDRMQGTPYAIGTIDLTETSLPPHYGTVLVVEAPMAGRRLVANRRYRAAAVYPVDLQEQPLPIYEHDVQGTIDAARENMATVSGWALCHRTSVVAEDVLEEATAAIGRLLTDLAGRVPLERSNRLRDIVRTVAQQLRDRSGSADVDAWARQMARDVSDATD